MSTKIYNAYCCKKSVPSCFKELEKIKRKVYPKLSEVVNKCIAKMYLKDMCLLTLGEEKCHAVPKIKKDLKEPFSIFFYHCLNEIKKAADSDFILDCNMDFKIRIVVYPYKWNKTLLQYFASNPVCNNIIYNELNYSSCTFKNFEYWNNADYPEGLSKFQWKQRKKVWDKIFQTYMTPECAGLSYTVFDYYDTDPIFEKDILSYCDVASVIDEIVLDIMTDDVICEHQNISAESDEVKERMKQEFLSIIEKSEWYNSLNENETIKNG